MPAPTPLQPWLVADIGGTNARFGWVTDETLAVREVRALPVAAHAGPVEAARAYLDGLAEALGGRCPAPARAAFAVATSGAGDEVAFTNSPWRFSVRALQDALAVQPLRVLNDFEALALAVPHLGHAQLRAWGALPGARATRAVIGPGTGLGVAGVVPSADGWLALPGEGGHATLAATDDFEAAVLQHARREFAHVSAERLLSGIGLPVLQRAVAGVLGQVADDLSAEVIVTCGLASDDTVCSRTLDTFCALLGGFAGNVALTLGARGGVYIGGGIVPRLGERFFASRFRACFEAKGRFRDYLREVPTVVITDTLAALHGAALALAQADDRGRESRHRC